MSIRPYLPRSFAAFLLLLLASQLHAQQGQSAEDRARLAFEARLSRAIKKMTADVNSENAELNTRLSAINAVAPLEKKNLDSNHVAANVSNLLEFIEYLKHARAASDTLAQNYEDSLYIFATTLPPDIDGKGIQNMDASFHEDRAAFNVFLEAMTKLYSDVLDVLLYLEHTPYSLAHNEFTFTDKKDLKEYQKRMKIVDADNKELNQANQEMRKANAKANSHTKNPSDDLEEN
jgi:hypothetical protein